LSKTVKQYDKQVSRLQKSFNKTNRGNSARAISKIVREKEKQVFESGSEYVNTKALAQLYDTNNESRQASYLRNSNNLQRHIEDSNKELMSRADSNGKIFYATAEDVMSKDELAELKGLETKPPINEGGKQRLQFLQHKQAQANQVASLRAGKIGNIKINAAVTNKVQTSQENAGVRHYLLTDYQKHMQSTDYVEQMQATRNLRDFESLIRDDAKLFDPQKTQSLNSQITGRLLSGGGGKFNFQTPQEEESAASDLSKLTAIYNGIMEHDSRDPAYISKVVNNLANVLGLPLDRLDGIGNLTDQSNAQQISTAKQKFLDSDIGKRLKLIVSNAGSFYGGDKV
jgi:hypothetical protein